MKTLHEALKAYDEEEAFEDTFPTIPLLLGNSEEEVIEMINECIKNKKDVYEMGYLTLDPDIIY